MSQRFAATRPPRFVVIDAEPSACPYLPGQLARLPLRMPLTPVSPAWFDRLLGEGDRRAGAMLYRTACDTCRACQPLRVPVSRFAPTRSQRKVLRRNADVTVELGPAQADEQRVALYNKHKAMRGLDRGEGGLDVATYARHYVDSCTHTAEVRYLVDGQLIGVSILDLGQRAASSVYHYFDPEHSRRSLGVFSACREIALCQELGLDWYYLGLWVQDCPSLSYKSQYMPHERLIDGRWQPFEPAAKEP